MMLESGSQLGHYRVLSTLGAGGMGEVYRARDSKLERDVAIKVLPAEFAADTERLARFEREAKALAALNHPNVATIFGFEREGDTNLLVMELVDGEDLAQRLSGGPIPQDEAISLFAQIAEGLESSHESGIVHRDLKPANIKIADSGRVKIVDFGLAKVMQPVESTQTNVETRLSRPEAMTQVATRHGEILGTAAYMCPEQARGQTLDQRADVWAFGVCLYEALTGRAPFSGATGADILVSVLTQEPDLSLLDGVASPRLEQLIRRCLEKDPDSRLQSLSEARLELEGALGSAPRGASRGAKSEGTGASWPLTMAAGRRNRWLVGVLGLALVATALFFVGRASWRAEPAAEGLTDAPTRSTIADSSTAALQTTKAKLAVLPFVDLTQNAENEVFIVGLAEDITTQLSKIGSLTVISRSSVSRFDPRTQSPGELARALGVDHVVQGSIRQSGRELRITAQLVDATTDSNRWADTYDRVLEDIFDVQSDVARQIAAALKLELTPDLERRIGSTATRDVEAYNFYRKGLEYYRRYTAEDNDRALELFDRAQRVDPQFALAHAGLADAYFQRVMRFGSPASEIGKATDAAQNALELDPQLAEGHKALGNALIGQGRYRQSLDHYLQAVRLEPSYATAVGNIGTQYWLLGRLDESLLWTRRAVDLNPVLADFYANHGAAFSYLGDDAEAERWFERAFELEPDSVSSTFNLGELALFRGDTRNALEHASKLLERSPGDVTARLLEASAHWFGGDQKSAEEAFSQVAEASYHYFDSRVALGEIYHRTDRSERGVELFEELRREALAEVSAGSESRYPRYRLAQMDAVLGDVDSSLVWLRDAIGNGWILGRYTRQDPCFESLRSDPRFEELLTGIEADLAGQRARIPPSTRL